jgi:hypothetical protein
MKSSLAFLLIVSVTVMVFGAQAQVTGVVTGTTGTVVAGDGFTISPPVVFNGPQIDEQEGALDTGFGVTIEATSVVRPGFVEFQNGSATSGRYTFLDTETDVDITFANHSDVTQAPVLHSQIVAAGLGMFVGGECLTTLTPCSEITSPYTFHSFAQYPQAGAPASSRIAGASVEFQILSNGQSLYALNASTDLVHDTATDSNVFVDDTAQAQATLSGFQLQTPKGSQTAHGYHWGTTDLSLPIPTVLAPGQSTTVTYQTITRSYSRTDCVAFTACVIGYSAFGDPIGMSGGVASEEALTSVFAARDLSSRINGLSFATFDFAYPTYDNGVLTYVLEGVPEPDAWGLLLAGFGLVGLSARRQARGRRRAPGIHRSRSLPEPGPVVETAGAGAVRFGLAPPGVPS